MKYNNFNLFKQHFIRKFRKLYKDKSLTSENKKQGYEYPSKQRPTAGKLIYLRN